MSGSGRALAILAGAAAVLAGLYFLRLILLPFVAGIFLAYLLSPLVERVESQGLHHTAAIWLVFGTVVMGAGLAAWLLLPVLSHELGQVVERVGQQSGFHSTPTPGLGVGVGGEARVTAPGVGLLTGYLQAHRIPEPWLAYARQIDGELQRWFEQLLRRALRAGVSAMTTGYTLVFAPFIAYYLVRDWRVLPGRLQRWLPPAWRPAARQAGGRLGQVLTGFVRGQLLISALVGVATAGAMLALRVPFAFTIGLLGGLFEMVPYIGPVIAGIPAVLAASVISPWTTIGVVIAFVIIHQVESTIIEPRIMGEVTGLHPLVVLGAVLVGEELLGVVGMLLAVPVTAMARVLLEFWLLRPNSPPQPEEDGPR